MTYKKIGLLEETINNLKEENINIESKLVLTTEQLKNANSKTSRTVELEELYEDAGILRNRLVES